MGEKPCLTASLLDGGEEPVKEGGRVEGWGIPVRGLLAFCSPCPTRMLGWDRQKKWPQPDLTLMTIQSWPKSAQGLGRKGQRAVT